MKPHLLSTVALFALSAALAAGCGGGDSTSKSTAPSPQATATAPPATTSGEQADTSTGETGTVAVPTKAATVKLCKDSVNSNPTLDAGVKSRLLNLCDKAASGDEDAAREAGREVCRELAKVTLPAGELLDQALANCDRS